MTDCATTKILISAFRDYLYTQNKAQKDEMLKALEAGHNISFGYGVKITLPKKKPVSRVRRKKPEMKAEIKTEIPQESCKVASISVLINMDGLKKDKMKQVSKLLKSDRHHLKLYDVQVRGKSGIAKAYVYEKTARKASYVKNVNPLLKDGAEDNETGLEKTKISPMNLPKWMRSSHSSGGRGMRKRQKAMAGIERKLAVFLKEDNEAKDKDPP